MNRFRSLFFLLTLLVLALPALALVTARIWGMSPDGVETYSASVRGTKGSLTWQNSQTLQAIGQAGLNARVTTNGTVTLTGKTLFEVQPQKPETVTIYFSCTSAGQVTFTLKRASGAIVLSRNVTIVGAVITNT